MKDMDQGKSAADAAPSGHPGNKGETAIEQMRRRTANSEEVFAARLRYFVERYAPRYSDARDQFQQELMQLFIAAMREQSSHLALGVEIYASTVFRERALAPLNVIFEDPQKTRR